MSISNETATTPTTDGTRPKSRRKWSWRKTKRELYNLLTVLILLVFALPAIWIVLTAFRPANEINVTPPIWIPQHLTLDAFTSLFGLNPDYASGVPVTDYLRNSTLTALISTTIALTFGTMTGYAFSRFEFKYHTFIFLMIMLSRAVPGVALGLPLFLLMRKYNLVDTTVGLAFVYAAINIPFTSWLMDGFFRQVPKELDESAYIDGCGYWSAFWRIDLPLALPGMAAAGIFAFLASWNEYQIASLLTKTPKAKTFPVGLYDFTSQFTVDWRGMTAMSVLMIIPAIIFVILIQRRLTEGLTFGALKG
jgi:multiple sugar transport system permease protein